MAYTGPMDVLGDVVEMTRTGPPLSLRLELRSPWALRSAEGAGAAFHVVLQGACWLILSDNSDPQALGPGDIVLLPRGARHVVADDPRTPPVDVPCLDGSTPVDTETLGGNGARSLLLSGGYRLDWSRPHPLLAALPEVLHVPADPGRHLRAAIALLGEELESARPGRSAILPALIDAMFPLIVRAWIDNGPPCQQDADWPAALGDPAIVGALEGIHADPDRDWTVESLAHEAGLSRAAFARRFAAAVGEPPLTYLTRWRMTVAGRLLRESDLTLAAVARRVGYTSEFAFAKAFKRDHGIAPARLSADIEAITRPRGGRRKRLIGPCEADLSPA
jgi:AraC-like DNA-binding protein